MKQDRDNYYWLEEYRHCNPVFAADKYMLGYLNCIADILIEEHKAKIETATIKKKVEKRNAKTKVESK